MVGLEARAYTGEQVWGSRDTKGAPQRPHTTHSKQNEILLICLKDLMEFFMKCLPPSSLTKKGNLKLAEKKNVH